RVDALGASVREGDRDALRVAALASAPRLLLDDAGARGPSAVRRSEAALVRLRLRLGAGARGGGRRGGGRRRAVAARRRAQIARRAAAVVAVRGLAARPLRALAILARALLAVAARAFGDAARLLARHALAS